MAIPSRSTIIRVRLSVLCMLCIAGQERGDSRREMLVPSMSGDEQGMALLIVQQQERSAAQDNAAFARSVHAGGACHCKQARDGRLQKPGQRTAVLGMFSCSCCPC